MSSLRFSKYDVYDGLVGAADIAELLEVPIPQVYERTRRGGIERIPISNSGRTSAVLERKDGVASQLRRN